MATIESKRRDDFRIVAVSEEGTCISPEFSFMTGPVPDWAPVITKSVSTADAPQGSIVTTPGFDTGFRRMARGLPSAYIFDTDGDIVWWVPELAFEVTRAHMSWDGDSMWLIKLNVDGRTEGEVIKVSMDGTTTEWIVGLEAAHHDFAVLPDGIATMLNGGNGVPDSFVELKADGSIEAVVADLGTLHQLESYHPNAVHYHAADDSYTRSDLVLNGFVKFSRDDELLWQLGGDDPQGPAFELIGLEPWTNSHGHHLTSDGRFLFFNNAPGLDGGSIVFEVILDKNDFTATKSWEYESLDGWTSWQLGDAERLPNGNVLVTYSMSGLIQEVTPAGEVVQAFDNSHSFATRGDQGYALFGYADFRTSLYGPPPR